MDKSPLRKSCFLDKQVQYIDDYFQYRLQDGGFIDDIFQYRIHDGGYIDDIFQYRLQDGGFIDDIFEYRLYDGGYIDDIFQYLLHDEGYIDDYFQYRVQDITYILIHIENIFALNGSIIKYSSGQPQSKAYRYRGRLFAFGRRDCLPNRYNLWLGMRYFSAQSSRKNCPDKTS